MFEAPVRVCFGRGVKGERLVVSRTGLDSISSVLTSMTLI